MYNKNAVHRKQGKKNPMNDKCTELFKALADKTRQEILALLGEREQNVNEICKVFEKIRQPTISHHLKILKKNNLVDSKRAGKMIYYSLNKKVLRNTFEEFIEKFGIQLLK